MNKTPHRLIIEMNKELPYTKPQLESEIDTRVDAITNLSEAKDFLKWFCKKQGKVVLILKDAKGS